MSRTSAGFVLLMFLTLAGTRVQAQENTLSSARVQEPPVIDGRLDDAAWAQGFILSRFVQHYPEPGANPTYRTKTIVVHDDQALYVAMECDDPKPEQIVARVARRDTEIESDWVRIEIDSRFDRLSGFYFQVNAAGVKLDGTLFAGGSRSVDWDGVWHAASHRTQTGWQAEFKIPFKLLRYSPAQNVHFGFMVIRHISRLNETVHWPYIAPESNLWVSRFAVLSGLDLTQDQSSLQLSPYLSASIGSQQWGNNDPVYPLAAGLDSKLGLGNSFQLAVTANPDFGQVEADPAELNLTTFETYYPEKRAFFLEDMALFKAPSAGFGDVKPTLFYTRRIGRSPRLPDHSGTLLREPKAPIIYGAAKLSGRTSGGTSVGILQAVTSEERAVYEDNSGRQQSVLAEPLSSYSVLRAQQDFQQSSTVTGMATATTTENQGAAVTGGTDLRLEVLRGKGLLKLSGNFSYLTPQRFRWHDAYTQAALEKDPLGYSGDLILLKQSGSILVGAVGGGMQSPSLSLNDLGYQRRADEMYAYGWLQHRRLAPLGPITRYYLNANAWLYRNTQGLNIGDGANLNGTVELLNGWSVGNWVMVRPPSCDDRETRTAGAVAFCDSRPVLAASLWGSTDSRKVVWVAVNADVRRQLRGNGYGAGVTIAANPHDRLQLQLQPVYRKTQGGLYWVETKSTDLGDRFVFAERHSEQIELIVRGSFTFSKNLTLQLYSQTMFSSVDSRKKLAAHSNGRSRIDVDDLESAQELDDNYDQSYSSLSLNSVVRWEFRPGCLAYLVYSGHLSQSSEAALQLLPALTGLPSGELQHSIMVKLVYYFG